MTHVADTPGDCAFFRCSRSLVGLAVDAKIHDVVAANGAVVDHDVCRVGGRGGTWAGEFAVV